MSYNMGSLRGDISTYVSQRKTEMKISENRDIKTVTPDNKITDIQNRGGIIKSMDNNNKETISCTFYGTEHFCYHDHICTVNKKIMILSGLVTIKMNGKLHVLTNMDTLDVPANTIHSIQFHKDSDVFLAWENHQ